MTDFKKDETKGFPFGLGAASLSDVRYEGNATGPASRGNWTISGADGSGFVAVKFNGGESSGAQIKLTISVNRQPNFVHAVIKP